MGLFTRKPASMSVGGQYYATHPAIPGHYTQLNIVMTDGGISVETGKKKDLQVLHRFAWDEITGFDSERQTEVRGAGQRLTATRMVTLGVFSLAAPKATGRVESSFINTLHTTTGDIVLEIELETDAGSALGAGAVNFIKRHGQEVRAFVAARANMIAKA